MSQWTNFRDAIEGEIENVKLDELAKQELTKNLVDNVMPAVDAWVDKLSAGLTEEAKEETGWCKIRDGIVLPYPRRHRPAVCAESYHVRRQAGARTDAREYRQRGIRINPHRKSA